MNRITDQLNRVIQFKERPRIVSLVPSQTELLYDLGCADDVVGITKFCIHPNDWFRNKTRVGGTKNVNFDKIDELNPDLIIANKEENTESEILALAERYPVYISDILNITDACQMIEDVGEMTGHKSKAIEMVQDIKSSFQNLSSIQGNVLYLIWKNPIMVAGNNTFIGHLLNTMGLKNAIIDPEARYIELTDDEIKAINPDYIFLSSEPYPFKDKDIKAFQVLTKANVQLVDGEMFSWYGSRMLLMADYINTLVKNLKNH
ncbi:ABC transporter substrate-binding protein [Crocinitomix catalasitica]|uniref:ABC transporter substrate-binding protein n=1 Tax=Crocinitomix catalasitica TaxID=184607 RepID=UPI00048701D2|nr:helical backbone metal receptor [Crocinitomix catalasitica]